jgi:malonate-semialdehyde dehydrogenase (acetylating) / methylmalonate-semialdehyde dehydrogenase
MSSPAQKVQPVPVIPHYIGGRRVLSESGRQLPVYNPATGEPTSQVGLASVAETEAAIAAAHAAFPGWSNTPPLQRARVMFRFNALLEAHEAELAKVITSEHGKVFSDARGEVVRGREVVEFACGIPHLLKGEFSDSVGSRIDSWSLHQPVGVCAGITPFNFPIMVPLWMVPIALACGNTFVLKPSEKDPSASLRLAELLTEAGLPAGVLNVVNGDRVAVDTLLNDSRVGAISFVGSTPIAQHIYETGTRNGKRVQALGGAKNHAVVLPDADPAQVAKALIGAAYGSAGERCMAISVAVCVGSAADTLIDELKKQLTSLRVGPGVDDPDMGPLITAEHRAKVAGYLDAGVAEKAELVIDGRKASVPREGFFLGASLFDRVTPNMRIYREEIFGPVLCVVRVESFDQAVQMVNEHEFGNGTAIFTRDGGAARRYCHEVQVGMVGVNVPIPVPMAFHSFGGWKRSLFGDLHVHGPDGVRFYSRLKTVTSRWQSDSSSGFVMPTMK